MARSQTLGLDYALPENRYINPSPEAAAPETGAVPFFPLPKTDQDLAYVEGISDKYFDVRGKIEAYALDMSKQYGVDVTKPDYTQPGGGIPFKTFQKLATQLLVTANDLKTSREDEIRQQQGIITGTIRPVQGFDQTQQPINRVSPDQMFHTSKLLPEIEQANEILKTNVYTDADYNRFKQQVVDPLVSRLTTRMNSQGISPAEKQYLQYNIDALVQQPKSTPYAYFQDRNGKGKKSTIEVDLLKKVTNLSQAKWPEGSYTTDTDEKGNPVLVSKALEGEQAGEHVYEVKGVQKRAARVIDGLVKKADGVYFVFKQGDDVEIPPVKVSSKAGDEVTKDIITSNPKYGSVHKMYEAMRELNLADESGSLINDKVLAGKEFDTPDPTEYGAGINAEKQRIVQELKTKRKSPGVVNRESMTFDLPDGTKATVYPNRIGGGWYVKGFDENNLSEQEVVDFLAKEKYFNKFLSEPVKVGDKVTVLWDGSNPQQVKILEIDSETGDVRVESEDGTTSWFPRKDLNPTNTGSQKTPEQIRAEELIDKYKKP